MYGRCGRELMGVGLRLVIGWIAALRYCGLVMDMLW